MLRAVLLTGMMIWAIFASTRHSQGGALKGAQAGFYNVDSDPFQATLAFKAGARASVFAKGDLIKGSNEATGSLLIEVRDGAGKLVATTHDTEGYAVAFWYPPRSGDYTIQVHNNSGQSKRLYICIK